jgi:hypothetical protein
MSLASVRASCRSRSLMTALLDPPTDEFGPGRALLNKYVRQISPEGASQKAWRVRATATNPMLFALIYLPHHLKNVQGRISIAQVHEDWANQAKTWLATSAAVKDTPAKIDLPSEQGPRDAYVAPRNTGKSTWWFLILVMWAAAHGHKKFAAAFADSGTQAEIHLKTFKNELDSNKLLRSDFPELCRAKKRVGSGQAVSDNQSMIIQNNGFVFAARGIDASNLGLKVFEDRPDLLIFDDVEPQEANYSIYQAEKRRGTIIEAVLPMNLAAHVVFVGTVTMPGSIVHQLVLSVMSQTEPEEWILDEKIDVHYYEPITVHEDGSESSIWPEKWTLKYLKSIAHTRTFAKNFKNMPVSRSGDYWTGDEFRYCDSLDGVIHGILSIDPATTKKKTSDYTGLALMGFVPGFKPKDGSKRPPRQPKVVVEDAQEVKLMGENLRKRALAMIENSKMPIRMVYIEVNQGGETWYSVFHDMPVPVKIMTNSVAKEVRAANTLGHYQRGHVEHYGKLVKAEEQMVNYPDVLNDDIIDAIGNGVTYYAKRRRPGKRAIAKNASYT